jgi:hypothetical protein
MARTMKTQDQAATEPVVLADAETVSKEATARSARPGSKLAKVLELLESEAGATIAEIMTASSWQQHTVRGALAGSITKKLGRTLSSEKIEGRGRVYRIARTA